MLSLLLSGRLVLLLFIISKQVGWVNGSDVLRKVSNLEVSIPVKVEGWRTARQTDHLADELHLVDLALIDRV